MYRFEKNCYYFENIVCLGLHFVTINRIRVYSTILFKKQREQSNRNNRLFFSFLLKVINHKNPLKIFAKKKHECFFSFCFLFLYLNAKHIPQQRRLQNTPFWCSKSWHWVGFFEINESLISCCISFYIQMQMNHYDLSREIISLSI